MQTRAVVVVALRSHFCVAFTTRRGGDIQVSVCLLIFRKKKKEKMMRRISGGPGKVPRVHIGDEGRRRGAYSPFGAFTMTVVVVVARFTSRAPPQVRARAKWRRTAAAGALFVLCDRPSNEPGRPFFSY